MQALLSLHRTIKALDREMTALSGYSDDELQELTDMIEALQEYLKPIRNEAGKRELSAQNSLLR
jgi:hypothetical protein